MSSQARELNLIKVKALGMFFKIHTRLRNFTVQWDPVTRVKYTLTWAGPSAGSMIQRPRGFCLDDPELNCGWVLCGKRVGQGAIRSLRAQK